MSNGYCGISFGCLGVIYIIVFIIGSSIVQHFYGSQPSHNKYISKLETCNLPDKVINTVGFIPIHGLQVLKLNVNKTVPFSDFKTFNLYQSEFKSISCVRLFCEYFGIDKVIQYFVGNNSMVMGYIKDGIRFLYSIEWDINNENKCDRILQLNSSIFCDICIFEINQIYPNSQRSCATQRIKDNVLYYIEYNTSDCSKENLLGIFTQHNIIAK